MLSRCALAVWEGTFPATYILKMFLITATNTTYSISYFCFIINEISIFIILEQPFVATYFLLIFTSIPKRFTLRTRAEFRSFPKEYSDFALRSIEFVTLLLTPSYRTDDMENIGDGYRNLLKNLI